jgi:hypothetical protein
MLCCESQAATGQAAQVEAARLDNLWLRSLVRRLQDSSQLPDAFRQYEAKLERAQRREEMLLGEIRRQRREATQLRVQGRTSRPVSPNLDTAKLLGTSWNAVALCSACTPNHAQVDVLGFGVTYHGSGYGVSASRRAWVSACAWVSWRGLSVCVCVCVCVCVRGNVRRFFKGMCLAGE